MLCCNFAVFGVFVKKQISINKHPEISMYDQETDTFELEKGKPLVLLLGSIGHEGVLSTLRTSGRQYKNKFLESRAKNWQSIINYFDVFTIEGVLVKLSPHAISLMASDEYDGIRENLLQKIGRVPHIVFVYEDILTDHFENVYWSDGENRSLEESIKAVLVMLSKHNIHIMPYRRNAEVTIMAESFLSETEQHLIFRLYVPSGRIWSNESDKLLQLFREYLSRVANIKVRLDQYRTDKGIIYEIHSEEIENSTKIGNEFSEFTQFMNLCASDTEAAEQMLKNKDVDKREIVNILSRYSKEAKRLSVDLKHEREQKVLSIRQRLESELVDSISGGTDWRAIESLVNLAVPQLSGVQGAISVDQESMRLPSPSGMTSVTINLNPQIVETVNGIVAQEISGDHHINPETQHLLEFIKLYAGKDAQELASSVHELEDTSAPKPGRLNAKQKLKKFLIDVGSKAGNVAAGVLQSYIEKQLGL
jgi:hypothetical protein